MLDRQRERRLQAIVDDWSMERLRRPGGTARAIREFATAYGNWAYLCGDQFHLGGAVATDQLAARAGLRPGMRVLDVACFLGGPARYLARRFQCQVTGLDISKACVQGAKRLTEAEYLTQQVDFIQGDAWQMPLCDNRFDVVWGQDSWPHADGLFEECARVLVPGGVMAFTNSVRGDVGSIILDDEGITYEAFTADQYGEMLISAGFEVCSLEDIAEEIIVLWEELEQRLLRQKTIWQAQLGESQLLCEMDSLAVTLDDYRRRRIGHVRITARKRR